MRIDPHQFCDFAVQIADALMEQIYAGSFFVFIAAFPKTGQGFVAQRLFLVAGGVESILIMDVQHQILNNLVIGQSKQFFYNERTHNNIDWGIGS